MLMPPMVRKPGTKSREIQTDEPEIHAPAQFCKWLSFEAN